MDRDTDLGGSIDAFPATRCSVILSTASQDDHVRKQAFETLVAVYWKPVYKYLRMQSKLSNEDAKDLTQAFFTRALEKGFFERYDPKKARFRTFLRVCLDGFTVSEWRAAHRIKRGGEVAIQSMDFSGAEGEILRQDVADRHDPDEAFRQEWLRGLFSLAVEDLRSHCEAENKQVHFQLFERYDLEGPDSTEAPNYAQLGVVFGLPVTQVTNYLAYARRQFRVLLLERLCATTGSEEEFQLEARQLLGGNLR